MKLLSACIIVKNEENNIRKCLESIANVADEIIIFDTGSTDKTLEIAREFDTTIITSTWNDDFSLARNSAKSYCKGNYILSIDADETLINPSILKETLESKNDNIGGFLIEIASPDDVSNSSVNFFKNIRLFLNHKDFIYEGRIHEQIAPSIQKAGFAIKDSHIMINHLGYTDENILSEKYKRNLRLLDLAMNEHPDDINNYYNLGKTLSAVGDFVEAETFLQKTYKLIDPKHPMYIQILNQLARNYYKMKKYEKALEFANLSISQKNNQIWANLINAEAYYMISDFKNSKESFNKALSIGSNFQITNDISGDILPPAEEILFKSAKCSVKLGDMIEAVSDFKKAIKINPGHIPSLVGLANVNFKLGNYIKSRDILLDVLKLSPTDEGILHFLEIVNDKVIPKNLRITNKDPEISVCLIVKNEENFLKDCLKSISSVADEIIVIDTGSTDNTISIAKEFDARVYSHHWHDDFSAARNEALMHATKDWILFIDADERLKQNSANDLKNLLSTLSEQVGGLMCVIEGKQNNLNGTSEYHRGVYPRIFRNYGYPQIKYFGIIHEQVLPSLQLLNKTVINTNITFLHIGYDQEHDIMFEKVKRNYKLLIQQVKNEPEDAYSWYQLGQTLGQFKLLKESEDALKMAISFGTLSKSIFANAAAVLAHYAGSRKDFTESLNWSQKSVDAASDFLYAVSLYAHSLLYLERFDEAEEEFIKALKLSEKKMGFSSSGFDVEIPKSTLLEGLQKARNRSI